MNGSPWFSVPRAARYLELSPHTVRAMVRDGRLSVGGFAGGRMRIHVDELDRYIRTSRQNARWAAKRRERGGATHRGGDHRMREDAKRWMKA